LGSSQDFRRTSNPKDENRLAPTGKWHVLQASSANFAPNLKSDLGMTPLADGVEGDLSLVHFRAIKMAPGITDDLFKVRVRDSDHQRPRHISVLGYDSEDFRSQIRTFIRPRNLYGVPEIRCQRRRAVAMAKCVVVCLPGRIEPLMEVLGDSGGGCLGRSVNASMELVRTFVAHEGLLHALNEEVGFFCTRLITLPVAKHFIHTLLAVEQLQRQLEQEPKDRSNGLEGADQPVADDFCSDVMAVNGVQTDLQQF
jgi:hypothetical protein